MVQKDFYAGIKRSVISVSIILSILRIQDTCTSNQNFLHEDERLSYSSCFSLRHISCSTTIAHRFLHGMVRVDQDSSKISCRCLTLSCNARK